MVTREEIINELATRGYYAEAKDVVKNGVSLTGISIRYPNVNIAPQVYIDDFLSSSLNKHEIADIIEDTLSRQEQDFHFDINLLTDKAWLLNHLYIALQKASTEPLIKSDCSLDGLEQYIYIRIKNNDDENNYSIKLKEEILKRANINLDDAWLAATNNTFKDGETLIMDLGDLFFHDTKEQIFLVTNKRKCYGSSAILDTEHLKQYFQSLEHEYHDFISIPSSIHEWILIPKTSDYFNYEHVNHMIAEVNAEQVRAEEQLGNHYYVINL